MSAAVSDPLPTLLLPRRKRPHASTSSSSTIRKEWTPKRHTLPPQPPPPDEALRREQEMAMARQLQDGKTLKKIRPRRTVDYGSALGRWAMLRKMRPNPDYVPAMHPVIPSIIHLLPPKAYPNNVSTSLCTKFIHTSTNKIRCPVNVVTWTPESRRVLTGSQSGEFTLWNGLTFNFETILQAHDSAVRAMRFTHGGAYLASADQAGIVKYFEPNMNNLTAWQAHREAVRGLTFSPDDRRFATCSDDSTLRLWAFEESREERVMTGHGWDVKCVEWHPTQGLLVSGSKDNTIRFWDPRSGTCLSTLHHHKNTIQALSWSPNGTMLASASRDATVRVFDIRALKEFRILRGHKKEVCSVEWHPIHPLLVSGGSEGSILHWDLSGADPTPPSTNAGGPIGSGLLSLEATPVINAPMAARDQAHDSNVWGLAFHPLGHVLASASNDHTTRFWARARPGEAGTAVAGAGSGERPPMVLDTSQADAEEDGLPGFGAGGGAGGAEWELPGLGGGGLAAGNGGGDGPPGLGGPGMGAGGPPGFGGPNAGPPGFGGPGAGSSAFGGLNAPPGFGGPGPAPVSPNGPPGFTANANHSPFPPPSRFGGANEPPPGFGGPPPGFGSSGGPPGFGMPGPPPSHGPPGFGAPPPNGAPGFGGPSYGGQGDFVPGFGGLQGGMPPQPQQYMAHPPPQSADMYGGGGGGYGGLDEFGRERKNGKPSRWGPGPRR